MTTPQDVPPRPLLRVVRGAPTAEELAALVAVVTARASAVPEPAGPPAPSRWGRPVLRSPLHPGPGAWRASSPPH